MKTRHFLHAVIATCVTAASPVLTPGAFASVPPTPNVEWEHITKVLNDQTLPLSWKDSDGHSRVFYHMHYGTEQDAVALVKQAREKNVRIPDRDVLAYHSIMYGKEFLLRELLSAGVSPNATSGNESLLMVAARAEQLGIMQQLIKAGADVNYESRSSSYTIDAMSYALETGKYNAARLLLDAGYKLSKHSKERITALFFSAIGGGHSSAVEYFLSWYDLINSISADGETPLTYAVQGERNDFVVAELLLRGADPCKRNKANKSAEDLLHEADKGKPEYDWKYVQLRARLVCEKKSR